MFQQRKQLSNIILDIDAEDRWKNEIKKYPELIEKFPELIL